MKRFFFKRALLPTGWASDVLLTEQGGIITKVECGAMATAAEHFNIAISGLPNVHSHTFQRAMAGLTETRGAESDNFWTWRNVMYRFVGALTPDDVEAIAAFAMMEMLERGFSSVAEFHYLHHTPDGTAYANPAELAERIVAAADATGIGLTLLPSYYQFGGFGKAPLSAEQRRFGNTPESFLDLIERCRTALAFLDDANLGIAPHSLRAVAPDALAEVLRGCGRLPIHIHVAEQEKEVEDCLACYGKRPVQWLLDNMSVDENWCLIHATHARPDEICEIAARRAVVGLCPITEANLGDGIFSARAFIEKGGSYGVGSDSNVQIGAAEELRCLEYSQRLALRSRNTLALDAGQSTGRQLYERALAGGRQALGRRTGQLAEDFRADFVTLRSDHSDLSAVSDDLWLDGFIFGAGMTAIDTVVVGGKAVVSDGRHVSRDEITARYRSARRRLLLAS
ncbi:MAG: formimidoylglutamate deiminase [Xanthobacteraceae bacterium]|nr:formimidoylglutamate deiminase [Xanthobacteraceae bacterium]